MNLAPTLSLYFRAMSPRIVATSLCMLWLTAATSRADGPSNADAEFFESRIRPILVEHCIACHGPEKSKGGLRLDARDVALKGGGGGAAVVPGDPDNSLLIEAIKYEADPKMPPKGKLSPQASADLSEWVKRGAPWPEGKPLASKGDPRKTHWSFQPIQNPPPPAVKNEAWASSAIDRFVLSKLEDKGLAPSPLADKRTLIRRASFDLTGLPPSPEEVAAFEHDSSADAFAKVVDRLLASPRYGERWGRHWLDVARYGDTKGYVFVEDPNYPWAFTYRDWVVRALNEDRPYDDFLVRQIAADRMVSASGEGKRDLAALGFLTVGSAFMKNNEDVLDDRIDVVTRGLMGLTVACARCHDHKFDPIPTADYYSLYGVFAGSVEPAIPPVYDDPTPGPEYDQFLAELATREKTLTDFVAAQHEELVASSHRRVGDYILTAQGVPPTDDDEISTRDGKKLNQTIHRRWKRFLDRTKDKNDSVMTAWHALAALSPEEFPAKAKTIIANWEAKPDAQRPINPLLLRYLREEPPERLADVAKLYARLLNSSEAIWTEYSERAALNGSPANALPDPAYEEFRRLYHGQDAPGEVPLAPHGDMKLITDKMSQEKMKALQAAVEGWKVTGPGAPPRAMAVEDAPRPFDPRIFRRGNPGLQGDHVPRRFLEVLSGPDRKPFPNGSGRLDLAQAIVARENPLTARSIVNRVWMHHFGRPIVNTPGDFGLRSDPPSHPELLDHLAISLMSDGWSLKRLHRRIMLSATYQQASEDRPEAVSLDPENVLLWKMNRRRLDFESTRDSLLMVSGTLDPTIGGRPVEDIMATTSRRRTLYGKIDRLNLPGVYRTFDYPDPAGTNPRRDQTTVTPQALFLMNHAFAIESARSTLKRPEVAAEADVERKVDRIYRFLYGRSPSVEETSLAKDFLTNGNQKTWEQYVQGLLMANEFVFVD